MAVRLTKDWIPVSEVLTSLKGNLGVFEFANVQREVVFIGFAGGKSQFGLKGEVAAALEKYSDIAAFRFEITTAYHTRYRELLMAHIADHDTLPHYNEQITLGRLSPS